MTGEKLIAFELESTQTGTTFVRRLFSASFAPGIGENGLTATLIITPFDFFGAVARKIS